MAAEHDKYGCQEKVKLGDNCFVPWCPYMYLKNSLGLCIFIAGYVRSCMVRVLIKHCSFAMVTIGDLKQLS